MYQVLLGKRAQKDLDRLEEETYQRVRPALAALADQPRPQGSRKLAGGGDYRIRVGDYRAIYQIDDRTQTVTVLRVKHRKDVYRES